MRRLICVRSALVGWSVKADTFDNELLFQSGAQAERAARRLAAQYAHAGHEAEVRIFLRDGSVAGRLGFTETADNLPLAG